MTVLAHPMDIIGLIALGFGVGAYGTLIGAGGGFVLMPVLILLYPHDSPELLTSISLAVVFFNTLSGSEAYAIMKRIDYKSGLLFAGAATPGAVFGALNTRHVPRHLFDIIFGAVLLAAAAFLAFRSTPKERPCQTSDTSSRYWTHRDLTDAHGTNYCFSFNPYLGIGISLFVGYLSSFFGIGGGIIHVPALTYLLHFPIHIATATSHFILAQMALAGTVAHILTGAFSQGVSKTISLAIGVLLGAQVGAHLSNRFKGVWLIRSLALALGLVAIKILYKAL